MSAAHSFVFQPRKACVKDRFDEFIDWAKPGGWGEFLTVHADRYNPDDPFFAYSTRFIPHSHSSHRAWLIRQEWSSVGSTKSIFSRAKGTAVPEIRRPDAFIPPGRYLQFAKAYLNIYTLLRGLRSSSKPTLRALIYLERALRDLNDGNNDPSHINHLTFKRACQLLQRCKLVPAVKFDAAKALEHMAMLLQGGGKFRGAKVNNLMPAFNVIKQPFSFRSPIKSPPKFGKAANREDLIGNSETSQQERNLTSEQVAAVGMAYQRATVKFGTDGVPTFYAAVTALPLTTASMRASELQLLRDDALYQDGDRPRLRVPRPKINLEQDIPIPKRLGPLAHELFNVIKSHSAFPREALAYYIKQSPNSHKGVHTLYIPEHLKSTFKKEYLSAADCRSILNPDLEKGMPQRLRGIATIRFVKAPGDCFETWNPHPVVQVRDILKVCRTLPMTLLLPDGLKSHHFISRMLLERISCGARSKASIPALNALFSEKAVSPQSFVRRDDVVRYLLNDFKKLPFPHWPFASKDRSVRLDRALSLHLRPNSDANSERGTQKTCWWLPSLLSIQTLNLWIGSNSIHPPHLFALTDVRLDDGTFPTMSVHQTRRYHHTTALAAGVNPHLLNHLAGRQDGWQAEAYDCRTPRQVLSQSMDTFDPDGDFDVIGPVADQAPSPRRIVERRIFLMENAAPKHIHETGGCSSDWSLDPCHRFGDCTRCESHLWRKGDVGRLPKIREMHLEATRIIKIGATKLLKNPRLTSVANHVRQAKESMDRFNEIFRVEADDSVAVGTIVTFSAAPSAMSDAQLLSWLRKRSRAANSEGATT